MIRYLSRRVGLSVVVLWLLSVLAFAMVRLIPGDPALAFANTGSSVESIAAIRKNLGLDRPLFTQYIDWIHAFVQGNFGTSLTQPVQIMPEIQQRYPLSFQLAIMALIIALLIGVPSGIVAARRPGSWVDTVVQSSSFLLLSFAPFIIGALLVLVNSLTVHWQISGYVPLTEDPVRSVLLLLAPAVSLAIPVAANLCRYTRVSMIAELEQPYIRTARSKGASEMRRIFRHAVRNALIPVVTIVGLDLGALIGGTIVVETVFSLPGMGSLLVGALNTSDYPTIQACVIVIGATYVVINLAIDLLYPIVDPRVRVSS
ncbi:ABC transporter permease [Leekyejoonella antrihumi]|uniref:ABC transporter permease n=1 Tax=Leekyejoonella antrihumi TaxID=1660198 RepID=A0A563DYT1_9MICO|nr:ABC transporter permease [Leekyejoonella antrihumi]TWP35418.1 ABC transporter permease [Leekyejoonella antrihumi]